MPGLTVPSEQNGLRPTKAGGATPPDPGKMAIEAVIRKVTAGSDMVIFAFPRSCRSSANDRKILQTS